MLFIICSIIAILGLTTAFTCWMTGGWTYWGCSGVGAMKGCCGGGGTSKVSSSSSLRRSTICSTIALALWYPSSSMVASVSLSSWWAVRKWSIKLTQVLSTAGFLIHFLTSDRKILCLLMMMYPMWTCCFGVYADSANSATSHRSSTALKMVSIGSLTSYVSFKVSSYFSCSSCYVIFP